MSDWAYRPQEAGKLLGWDALYIRYCARNCPEMLPFPVIVHGNRTQVPKGPLNKWLKEMRGE